MRFSGTVVHGDGIGKTLGYPTANIDVRWTDLADGVYAARAVLDDVSYRAACIVSGQGGKVEVYLCDYHGQDCYGKKITTDITHRVSDHVPGLSGEELLKKISEDITKIQSFV
jgi:riboflavin kinase / FMN adenylyltransferase